MWFYRWKMADLGEKGSRSKESGARRLGLPSLPTGEVELLMVVPVRVYGVEVGDVDFANKRKLVFPIACEARLACRSFLYTLLTSL